MYDRTIHGPPLLILLPILAFALVFALAIPASSFARDDVPKDVAALENPEVLEESEHRYYQRQYKGKCSRCHGADGDGSGAEAAPNMRAPADFTDAQYMETRTDGQLYYQILEGGGDDCAMPAFGPESDHAWKPEKIWHMVAFVRRYSRPAPK